MDIDPLLMKAVDKLVWETQLRLSLNSVSEKYLQKARLYLTPQTFENVEIERSSERKCAYPKCKNGLLPTSSDSNIRKMHREALEAGHSMHCSHECKMKSDVYRRSLSETSVYLRPGLRPDYRPQTQPSITVPEADGDSNSSVSHTVVGDVRERSGNELQEGAGSEDDGDDDEQSEEISFVDEIERVYANKRIKLWSVLSSIVSEKTLSYWSEPDSAVDSRQIEIEDDIKSIFLSKMHSIMEFNGENRTESDIEVDTEQLESKFLGVLSTFRFSGFNDFGSRNEMEPEFASMYTLSLLKLLNDHFSLHLDIPFHKLVVMWGFEVADFDACLNVLCETEQGEHESSDFPPDHLWEDASASASKQ